MVDPEVLKRLEGVEGVDVRWLQPVEENIPYVALFVALAVAISSVVFIPFLLGPPRLGPDRWLTNTRRPCRRVALVVAHPDDEAMFFWPTLMEIKQANIPVSVLCLSTGNADGLGQLRTEEMRRSCERVGAVNEDLVILDVDGLQDGMHHVWSEDLVAKHVTDFVIARDADAVITFDDFGVSGHPNHVATSRGVRQAARNACDSSNTGVACFHVFLLESVGFWQKYLGPLHLLFLPLSLAEPSDSSSCSAGADESIGRCSDAKAVDVGCSVNANPFACLRGLAAHRSQLVWYRFLSAVFSRYAYVNTYVRFGSQPRQEKLPESSEAVVTSMAKAQTHVGFGENFVTKSNTGYGSGCSDGDATGVISTARHRR
eukprot:TRINITY_DN22325_c0_g1_i1.p1 TRINITY_DN22325_c0_g1~~TRINITY_DN22325_c0_g1_i1.p1  ORF type:complete len:372 (-),score=49.49 TRINITY_DN22325_c0_g1_i1:137-1252(-)